jgi:hypothetical protein
LTARYPLGSREVAEIFEVEFLAFFAYFGRRVSQIQPKRDIVEGKLTLLGKRGLQ